MRPFWRSNCQPSQPAALRINATNAPIATTDPFTNSYIFREISDLPARANFFRRSNRPCILLPYRTPRASNTKSRRLIGWPETTSARRPRPMPRGFEHGKRRRQATKTCPGGTCDNSPTFQRWVTMPDVIKVPKGRLSCRVISAIPSGCFQNTHVRNEENRN